MGHGRWWKGRKGADEREIAHLDEIFPRGEDDEARLVRARDCVLGVELAFLRSGAGEDLLARDALGGDGEEKLVDEDACAD